MGLTREDELYRTFRIVYDLIETVQVAEKQMCSLIGGETAGKTDGQLSLINISEPTRLRRIL